jgi:glycine/D-amino acid oxidase-like deaminating enzyme
MDYGSDEFYFDLMEIALAGWDLWNRDWERPLYHEDGFMLLSKSEMQPGSFEYENFIRLEARGYQPERLNSTELRTRFPAWAAELYPDGYLNRRAGWAESGEVVTQLLAEAESLGVQLRPGTHFARLYETDAAVTGIVTTDDQILAADLVIMAAGAWTPGLLPYLREYMWPVGQPVCYFKPSHPADYRSPNFLPWAADISRTGWYGFPANAAGLLKIANHGVGWAFAPDEPPPFPAQAEKQFREFIRNTFPALIDAPLFGTRICFYCDTWDGNFWIDHDPERPGLVIATGGSGHGFKFAPVLGEIIADVVEGRANPWAARFAWRAKGAISKEDARYAGPEG